MRIFLIFSLTFVMLFKVSQAKSYDFAVDYELSKGDGGTTHTLEIMNEFSLTDRTSLGFDFLIEDTEGQKFKYFNFYHLLNFQISKDIRLGMQNGMRFYKLEDEEMRSHYEIKAIFSHFKEAGVYKNFTVENAYRRKFSAFEYDVLKSNFKLDLRIVESIDFVSDLETNVGLNKGYNYDLTLATIYLGVHFDLPKDMSLAVKYRRDFEGKEHDNRQGVMFSFSAPLNIF